MRPGYRSVFGCLAAGLGVACLNSEAPIEDNVGLTAAALSVCSETVPANRNVDGIPSYAQCADSNNAAIYSNNGVDTSTTQMGADWVKTQWSGGYQCTELAHRYLYFKWGVKWIPNGNAGMWCDSQPPANAGVVQTMTPVHGDIMVLAPGSCGADGTTGHVTVVDVVADSKLTVVEQNGARRGNYMASCAKCFLHVMSNNGTPSPATGLPPAAGAPAMTPPATPMTGAAGGAATPGTGFPGRGRPSMGAPASPAAGAAAPTTRPAATPPASTAPITPPTAAATTNTNSPAPGTASTMNSLAAGSGAVSLAGAVTPPTGTRAAPPASSACAVAAVGGQSTSGLPLAFGFSALAGLALRRRQRRSC